MNKNVLVNAPEIIVFIIMSTLMSCKNNASSNAAIASVNKPEITYRQAAEFEPTEAVWLIWSNYDHKEGFSNLKTQSDIIAALLPYIKIKLVVPNDSTINALKSENGPLSILAKTAIENGRLSILNHRSGIDVHRRRADWIG